MYYYSPKIQTAQEALIVEKLLARLEGMIGVPPGTLKIKVLYEEGNAGRFLHAIAWVLRRRLLGTNVGRWDYLAPCKPLTGTVWTVSGVNKAEFGVKLTA
jgi:malate synthase